MDLHTPNPEEQTVRELERRYWQAMQDRDGDAAKALSDEFCLVAGAQGFSNVSAAQLADMVPRAKYRLVHFHFDEEPVVKLLSPDVAVVAYQVHEDLVVEGDEVSFDAAETSMWLKRDGQWRCAMHTESIRGDPFGRDKLPEGDAAA